MSDNYKLMSRPANWVSAHRKNEFRYRLPQKTVVGAYNTGGYLSLILDSAFVLVYGAPQVGDRIFLTTGGSYGDNKYHTIKEITSSIQYVLTTEWIDASIGISLIYFVRLPEIQLYKGYRSGELVLPLYPTGSLDLYTIMPWTLIGKFYPEAGIDGFITFDISGYLKTAIESPYKVGYNQDEINYHYPLSSSKSYVVKNYNKVALILYFNIEATLSVANSAITSDELNRCYVDTDQPMQPLQLPLKFNGDGYGNFINNNLQTTKHY